MKAIDVGFENKKGQVYLGTSDGKAQAATQYSHSYRMKCFACGYEYLTSGSTIRIVVCRKCSDVARLEKSLAPKPLKRKKIILDFTHGSNHFASILTKCAQLIKFSTIHDIALEEWNEKKETAIVAVKLDCDISMKVKLRYAGGVFKRDTMFYSKQINGRHARVLDDVLEKHGDEIQKLNPKGKISKNEGKTSITVMIGNRPNYARYEINEWKLIPS